tara:strand:- start:2803 stop:3186 length:384 start_codon:yes stop_codon:yes gene_type:complete
MKKKLASAPKFNTTAVTEAKSKAMFLDYFSSDFVVNEINEDFFGIDYLLTKYEDGVILPKMAMAQLKATSIPGKTWIDIRVRDLDFWARLDLPVYLVLINIEDKTVKVRLVSEIKITIGNKYLRIKF